MASRAARPIARGVYEAWPITTKGEIDLRRWAFNVDPDEGDLTPVASADLLARLDPVKVNYHLADQYRAGGGRLDRLQPEHADAVRA